MDELTPREIKERIDRGESVHLLDVREPSEIALCALEGAEHIPMLQLFLGLKRTRAAEDALLVVFCHSGQRSLEAARYLRHQGHARVCSMAGGIDAWAATIDPALPRY
jgi:sulfur-carrier protein adenylyltransferase/sulfurtransferase